MRYCPYSPGNTRYGRGDEVARGVDAIMVVMHALPAEYSDDDLKEVEDTWHMLVSKGHHAEIVGGRLVMSPAPSRRHCNVTEDLADQFFELKRQHGWHIYMGSAVYIPHIRNRRVPDLVVTPRRASWYDENQLVASATLLVVEVVSPGKEARREDFEIKPEEYAFAGVPRYLVIDPEAEPRTLTLLSEPKDGEYTVRADVVEGEPLHLPAPFDRTLDTTTLFA
jgi:Uma2 family endonuclease